MMSLLCLFLFSLKVHLLLLFSLLSQVNIAVVEEQPSDFGKEELEAVAESCPEGIIADDPSFE